MTRTYNALAFMRHYELGLREGMALSVVSMFGVATTRNIMECMGISHRAAIGVVHRLHDKGALKRTYTISTVGTKHSPPRPQKCWKVEDSIAKELDILEATNRLPKWKKSQAAPASGKKL